MATQTVTVLFTDLVGSTELSSRLGPRAPRTCARPTSASCAAQVACTQLDLTELCLERQGPGDQGRAQELLDAVRQAIDKFGYHGLDARLDRLSSSVRG